MNTASPKSKTGREIDQQFGGPLARGCLHARNVREPSECRLERQRDRDAHAIRRKIPRIDDDVDFGKTHRRKDALRCEQIGADAEDREHGRQEKQNLLVAEREPGDVHEARRERDTPASVLAEGRDFVKRRGRPER